MPCSLTGALKSLSDSGSSLSEMAPYVSFQTLAKMQLVTIYVLYCMEIGSVRCWGSTTPTQSRNICKKYGMTNV